MTEEILNRLLWAINFLILFEAFFQLRPLIMGKPYASRRAYIVGILKYGGTLVPNLLLGNWAMSAWLAIGLAKETVGYFLLADLKEGYKV